MSIVSKTPNTVFCPIIQRGSNCYSLGPNAGTVSDTPIPPVYALSPSTQLVRAETPSFANICVGYKAGTSLRGVKNICIGANTCGPLTEATHCIIIGSNGGAKLSNSSNSGFQNSNSIYVGYNVAKLTLSGKNNIVIGKDASAGVNSANVVIIGTETTASEGIVLGSPVNKYLFCNALKQTTDSALEKRPYMWYWTALPSRSLYSYSINYARQMYTTPPNPNIRSVPSNVSIWT